MCRIRQFEMADADRLKQITVEAFDGVSIAHNIEKQFGAIHGRDWQWRKAREIDDDIGKDPEGIFVAEINSLVVGYVTTWIDADTGMGYIPNLAVDSQYRGHGLGKKLLKRAISRFSADQITHARIETLEQNEVGQSLYPSLGFQPVARQVHYCLQIEKVAG
ncbi:MAG: hypothetical protein CMJ81_06825 [Planctomycetaceae bacterium]|jgi:ribosomal protein S18 acetylase RimI-like enzyme|nr:hypothetical protein [Planctomycetaceae bacterium]